MLTKRGEPSPNPRRSCSRNRKDLLQFGRTLTLLETLGENAQGESLNSGYRFILRVTVRENAGNLWDLRDPAPIGLALGLYA